SLHRIQLNLLPAVRAWVPRDAAPVSLVPSGVSGSERHVHGRRFHSRGRLPPSDGLFYLVDALWSGGQFQSLAGNGTRMANGFTPAAAQFRDHASGHVGSLRFSEPYRLEISDGRGVAREDGNCWLNEESR